MNERYEFVGIPLNIPIIRFITNCSYRWSGGLPTILKKKSINIIRKTEEDLPNL